MPITAPDEIKYPDNDTGFTPQATHWASLADSVQAALNALRGASSPPVGTAAARNALYPLPVQGNSVDRLDLGYTERFFSEYSSGSNPGGATPAGWYPVGGKVPLGVARRKAVAMPIGAAAYVNVSSNTYWDTANLGGQVQGGVTYNDGFIVPVTGLYQLSWQILSGGTSFIGGIAVDQTTISNSDTMHALATSSATSAAAATGTGIAKMNANSVARLFLYSAGAATFSQGPGLSWSVRYLQPAQ